jgi:hypothetical protein
VHVVVGAGLELGDLVVGQLADDAAGRAAHQRAVGDHLAFGNQRVGADQAVLADHRPVEHHGIDADQRAFTHRAAVQHGLVADGDVTADVEGTPSSVCSTAASWTLVFSPMVIGSLSPAGWPRTTH